MDITHEDYCDTEGCTGECIDAEGRKWAGTFREMAEAAGWDPA